MKDVSQVERRTLVGNRGRSVATGTTARSHQLATRIGHW